MTTRVTSNSGNSLTQRVLPDLLAFSLGLGVAYYMEWETTDLVWSLWLCSLVLGYTTILSAIGGGAYAGLHMIRQMDVLKRHRTAVIFGGAAIGLFFLGFFSLHFCGFHAGHSVFLRQFFPLEGLPKNGFGDAFMNPPLLWMLVFEHLIRPYGVFLIPALIAERRHVFRPLIRAVAAVKEWKSAEMIQMENVAGKVSRQRNFLSDAMGRPYINVVRMHLLIFFFGFCHAMHVDSFAVYAVVYFVYFFPWSEFRRLLPARTVSVSS